MNIRIAHVNPDKKLIILYKIHELIQKTLVFPTNHTPGSGRTLRIPDEQTPFSTTSKLAATVGTDFVHVYYLSKMAKGHFPE